MSHNGMASIKMKIGKLSPHHFMLIFCRLLKCLDLPACKHNAVTLNGYVISCHFTPVPMAHRVG